MRNSTFNIVFIAVTLFNLILLIFAFYLPAGAKKESERTKRKFEIVLYEKQLIQKQCFKVAAIMSLVLIIIHYIR